MSQNPSPPADSPASDPAGTFRDEDGTLRVQANGQSIALDIQGPEDGKPLLLIMGLGMQWLGWPDGFIELLVRDGFRVIRYDNRDIGLSSPVPQPVRFGWQLMRHAINLPVQAPYSLEDMADDAAAILAGLGIPRADVCGVSMGGMIAQLLAIRHPARVRSLVLMMTSSGARNLPGPTLRVMGALVSRARMSSDTDTIITSQVEWFQLIGSPAFPTPPEMLRARMRESVLRAWRPDGTTRQLLAVGAAAPRGSALRALRLPVHVIHGTDDPLLPVACGEELAGLIPDATVDLIEGMGHDLPPQLWSRFTQAIRWCARRADPK